jgi:hypothetical protein
MPAANEALPPVLDRMLAFWNGEDIEPADVYVEGCVENGESTFGPADVKAQLDALRGGCPTSGSPWMTGSRRAPGMS